MTCKLNFRLFRQVRIQSAPMLLLLLSLPVGVRAGMIKMWQLKELAAAPVLVTGRVVAVHRNERVPESQLAWKAETWSMTADVEVLRSFTAPDRPPVANQVRVHFLSYGPSVTMYINGNPPLLPEIKLDEIRIFPLKQNPNPASDEWQLIADSGHGLTIQARAETGAEQWEPLPTARMFAVRELANTLSHGTPREIAALSAFLSQQTDDLSPEIMPQLELLIGEDRQQWAEVATSLHAALGVPRPTVAALFAAKPEPVRGNLPLLQAAIRKLKASPETEELLIKTWIADAPFHAWGSANSLIEFVANPITTETLRKALRDDLRGSSYIALVIAHSGNKAIIPDAVARAFRVIDLPDAAGTDFNDVQGAAALLRDYGSDQDLTQLAAIVRKYQTLNPEYYGLLWQDATGSANLREAHVLSVVLTDRRPASGEYRYCDYALGEFGRATGQPFDITAASVRERDEAISRALAWIKAQGMMN